MCQHICNPLSYVLYSSVNCVINTVTGRCDSFMATSGVKQGLQAYCVVRLHQPGALWLCKLKKDTLWWGKVNHHCSLMGVGRYSYHQHKHRYLKLHLPRHTHYRGICTSIATATEP